MSKKHRRENSPPAPKNNPQTAQPPEVATKPALPKAGTFWVMLGGIVVLVAGLLGLIIFWQPSQPTKTATPKITVGNPNARIGDVTCVEKPPFTDKLQFSKSALFSTSQRGFKGLVLIEPGDNPRLYQHPSWSSGGNLGPIESGKSGEIFVGPVPVINILDNPPDQQNKIYRVDGASGIMTQFITLPPAAPPNENNPFGVLGLGYDCEKANLYVSSVAGSNRSSEVGRIYRVDTAKKMVAAQMEKVDALGLIILNTATGKRLYYGLARLPELWSIGLDSEGNFQGTPRKELSLAGLGQRGSDKIRDLKFNSEKQLEIYGIEFSFNLIAPTEKIETLYRFSYNRENDTWTYLDAANLRR